MNTRAKGIFIILITSFSACDDFVRVTPPKQTLVKGKVFDSDVNANAAMLDIYNQMSAGGFASGNINSFSFIGALSSNDLADYGAATSEVMFQQFSEYTLTPDNVQLVLLWSEPYQYIFKANAILEGLKDCKQVSAVMKDHLSGEAKFFRAFGHFYLLNLFGDVPLILTTDYKITSAASRVPVKEVYEQIVADLLDAVAFLPEDYSLSNGERTRVNRWVANALLARVYLYQGNWESASCTASFVIGNSRLYHLEADLNNVFSAQSQEAIWQLSTATEEANTLEAIAFDPERNPSAMLSAALTSTFESGDRRKAAWITSFSENSGVRSYPYKYKVRGSTPYPLEYSMVLRLAEQYMIRAEANAHLGKTQESIADINLLRQRAALSAIDDLYLNQDSVLLVIEHERHVELFTEWGHRWLDLKRTGRVNYILRKLREWQPTDSLYPIPSIQISTDPNMGNAQNPGY